MSAAEAAAVRLGPQDPGMGWEALGGGGVGRGAAGTPGRPHGAADGLSFPGTLPHCLCKATFPDAREQVCLPSGVAVYFGVLGRARPGPPRA